MQISFFFKKQFKTISRVLLLVLVFVTTFAGGGGGGSNGGKNGGGSGGGGGKGNGGGGGKGNWCNFSGKKPLRVNLGNFQYLPNTITTAPQFTCGQNGPDFSATPHRFQASKTSGTPLVSAYTLLTNQITDGNYICEITVVSAASCEGVADQTTWYWDSNENYEDIEIYTDIACVITVRYWDRMNMFPCAGNPTNARGVWFVQYDNGGAIINDTEITVTPQLAAFSQ